MGSSLEDFDANGKRRAEADGAPVYATAILPDGSYFEGLGGLRTVMKKTNAVLFLPKRVYSTG